MQKLRMREAQMKRFKKVYIEIGNICNLTCDFCPETKREKEVMDLETFSKILGQVKPHTDYIYFHVKGEPLMHPKLGKFLDISQDKGFKVNITSNGALISQAKDQLLGKPALRQISFSLHSFDGNHHEDQYMEKRKAYFQSVFDFVKEARSTPLIISLRLWNLDKDNQANKERRRNRKLLQMIEEEFNLDYKIEEKIQAGRGIKLAKKVYLNQDHEFKWPDLKEEEDDGVGFCYGLRDQVAILVDGTVVPCCLDGEGVIDLGNIHKTSFTDIINSTRAQAIYDGFSQRKAVEELCRKCGYRQKFGK